MPPSLLTSFLLLTLVLPACVCLQPVTSLPPLSVSSHTVHLPQPLNITPGDAFTIPLPQLDLQAPPADLRIYEISQQKFLGIKTLQKHDDTTSRRDITSEGVFRCQLSTPSLSISQTLSRHPLPPPSPSLASQQSLLLTAIPSRQLLYTLDPSTMALNVYHYTASRLSHLSAATISLQPHLHSHIVMACSGDEQYLYIFAMGGMWVVQTHTVLTAIRALQSGLHGYNSYDMPADALKHGAYGWLFAIRRGVAVYLIPELTAPNNTSLQFHRIDKYNDIQLTPQDMYVDARLLYILDRYKGVYVYQLTGTGQVREYEYIEWGGYGGGNREVVVREGSVFVRYGDGEGEKVVELSYQRSGGSDSASDGGSSGSGEVQLVRYYKPQQPPLSISLQSIILPSRPQPHSLPMLFLLTPDQLHLYPYNSDPRLILTPHNGAKLHLPGLTHILYLFDSIYLLATDSALLYIRLQLQPPQLHCQPQQSTGHIYYLLQYSTNVSSCQYYSQQIPHKNHYNSYCQLGYSIDLYLNDPELSRLQKLVLYSVVGAVVVVFVGGLLGLVRWRRQQIGLIGRIKEEIVRFRERGRRIQPFVEEDGRGVVEFELPETLPIPRE